MSCLAFVNEVPETKQNVNYHSVLVFMARSLMFIVNNINAVCYN